MRISDWSSDVCSSDLIHAERPGTVGDGLADAPHADDAQRLAHQRMAQRDRGATAGPPALAQDIRILAETAERKSVVLGKSVYVSVNPGGRRILKKQNNRYRTTTTTTHKIKKTQ